MYVSNEMQKEVIRSFYDGNKRSIIADLLGISLPTVNKILRDAGINYKKVKYVVVIDEENSQIIKDLYEKCLPLSYMRDVTGLTDYQIRKHIKDMGYVKHNDISQKKLVKDLVKKGKSIEEIAKEINWDVDVLKRWMRSKGNMMFPINPSDANNWITERTCHICGKKIYRAEWETYAYKRKAGKYKNANKLYFCSWSCLRKYDATVSDFETRRI